MFIKSFGYVEKASRLKEGEVEVVVSTGDIDAHGERINIAGIDIKDFKKNPVVLWGHDGFNLPIARATKVWKEGDKLMAKVLFYLKDDFAKKVYDYVVDGFVNAVSIGGMVEEWGSDGMTIAKLVMKEFSFVSVPANSNALVTSKSLSTAQVTELQALANSYARKMFSDSDTDIRTSINTLKTLVTTLEEVALGKTYSASVDEQINRHVVLRSAQAVDKQVETVIRQVKLKGE